MQNQKNLLRLTKEVLFGMLRQKIDCINFRKSCQRVLLFIQKPRFFIKRGFCMKFSTVLFLGIVGPVDDFPKSTVGVFRVDKGIVAPLVRPKADLFP